MPREFISLEVHEISSVDHPANRRKWLVVKRDNDAKGGNKDMAKKKTVKFHGEDGVPMTTGQIVEQNEALEMFYELRWALIDSIDSILSFAEPTEQAGMLIMSVEEFAEKAKPLLASMAAAMKSENIAAVEALKAAVSDLDPEAIEECVAKIRSVVKPLQPKEDDPTMATKQELEQQVVDLTAKIEELEKLSETNLETVSGYQADITAKTKEIEDLKAEVETLKKAKADDTEEEDVMKGMSPAQVKYFEAIKAEGEEAKAIAKAERERRLKDEFTTKAASLKMVPGLNPDDHWEVFKKIAETMPEEWIAIENLLQAAHNSIEKSELTKTIGADGDTLAADDSAYAEIEALAAQELKNGTAKTKAEAIAKVTQKNPELYRRHRLETRRNGK